MLYNGVLRPKLFNIPLASCFLLSLDFLLPRIAHFDNMTVLLLLVFETLRCFLYFSYTLNNQIFFLYLRL